MEITLPIAILIVGFLVVVILMANTMAVSPYDDGD